jgi:hypothetical protein
MSGRWDRLAWCASSTTFILLVLSVRAAASLGGDVSSVQTDQVRIKGAMMRVTSSDRFTVHEMRAATGTTIREYVSSSGRVFGVAWQGPTLPDLRQVLGTYFDAYVQAAQAAQKKRVGRGPIRIEESTFVVERSGHPRAFVGRAYVPQFIPAGIGSEIVQ